MFVYIYIYIYIIFNNFILLLCVDSLVYSGFIDILEGVTNTDSDKKKLEDLVREKTLSLTWTLILVPSWTFLSIPFSHTLT